MKWVVRFLGVSGIASAVLSGYWSPRPTMIVITGDIAGYLSPCGCTSPMTGGITRLGTLMRRLEKSNETVLLSNGAMTGGHTRQDELKVATLAQTYGALKAAAINLSPEDARTGLGVLQTIQNLSDERLVCSSIEPVKALPIRESQEANGMLIGGISMHPEDLAGPMSTKPVSVGAAVNKLVAEAKASSLSPVVLLDGGKADAESLATTYPAIKLIVYRSTSESPRNLERVDSTLLVTPGQFGKSVLTLSFDGQKFDAYQVVHLAPDYEDDPQISRFYRAYLRMVDRAGFIDEGYRAPSSSFAGSEACQNCHASDYRIWKGTKHALGLKSLENEGHARDPDCVSCHVVGLGFQHGFVSRAITPGLASVGCESCHGPAKSHVLNPRRNKLTKAGTSSCGRCHNPERSPQFNSLTYWSRIKHG